MFNSEPNQNKKRKVVKVNNNEELVKAFDDFTKNDAANIQAYLERKNQLIGNQQDAIHDQQQKQQEIVDADNKKPASSKFEREWASHTPGTKLARKGRGNYDRDVHKGKTGNRDVSRHMKDESTRLKHRGKQYLSMKNYMIKPAKRVRFILTLILNDHILITMKEVYPKCIL